MKNETIPTVSHFIQEVPNFKNFIGDWIAEGNEAYKGSPIQVVFGLQWMPYNEV